MDAFEVHFEVLVTQEPVFYPGSLDPSDVNHTPLVAVSVVQVLDEDAETLTVCQTLRFRGTQRVSGSGVIVLPKSSITHRASLVLDEDAPEVPLPEDDIDIPDGVPEDLYDMSPEEKKYRGYDTPDQSPE